MAKDKIATALNNENTNIFQSETVAMVPYMMGVNAKNQMRRDNYLTSFIPRITPEILAKYHIESYGDMESAIYKDTRLFPLIVEDCINEMQEKWEQEIKVADRTRIAVMSAIKLIEARAKINKSMSFDMDQNTARRLTDSVITTEKIYGELLRKLNDIETLESKAETLEKKLGLRREINEIRREMSSYQETMAMSKATLIAFENFEFLGKLQYTQNTKDDVTTNTGYKNMTFAEYLNSFITDNMTRIKLAKKYYQDTYDCIPQFIKAYEDIISQMQKKALSNNPDMTSIYRKYEDDIVQYSDLLKDGPSMILQIARMFPGLVRNLDSEKALFAAGRNDFMNGQIQYKDDDDMYRARNEFFFSFLNILADEFTASKDSGTDRQILAIFGPPGIGKTAAMESVSAKMGYLFKSISIPHADGSIFSGLPTIDDRDHVVQFVSSDMAETLERPGIIDLEEATAATDPTVHAQLARFLQSGELGIGHKIHPLSIMVMTANDDIHHNPDLQLFSPVVMNRIRSVYWKDPDKLINGWINWSMNNKAIKNDKNDNMSLNFIMSFLMLTSEGRNYWIVKGSNETSTVSPSFRAWYNLAAELGPILRRNNIGNSVIAEKIEKAASNVVGTEAARALAKHYVIMSNIPDINKMIKRMEEGEPKWRIIDAIRVFDMNNSQLFDNTKNIANEETNEKAVEETKKGTKDKRSKMRFTLNPNPKKDQTMIDKLNKINEKQNRSFTVDMFMSKEDLQKRYNEIWGQDNKADLNNTAVLFHFTSEIIYNLDRVFNEAWENKQPVEGSKVDALFKLAMTLPAKDPRQALIIKLMYRILTPEKIETLYKYGMHYVDVHGKDVIRKPLFSSVVQRDGPIIKPDLETMKKENANDPRVMITENVRTSICQDLIFYLSEAYGFTKNKKEEDKGEDTEIQR